MTTKYSEMKDLSAKEIMKRVGELKSEMFNLKFSKHTSGLESLNKLRDAKKTVARLLTALNAKK
jgi:large subunit ribosomal protein L29